MVDLKKLQSINDEIYKYNEKMMEAQRSGGHAEFRIARREEARVKILASYSAKQRLRVTLVTIIPFAAVSLILGSLYGFRYVAQFPFPTPLGRDIPFYVWYTFCYFSAYLPLTQIFGPSMGATMPIRSNRGGI
ncbi:hypothetical protein MUP77_06275 [Candidatus Bathyarchaeota archaeon]|nr:hypothetical protein [Candidatus Bathyarchaeota archaeon]